MDDATTFLSGRVEEVEVGHEEESTTTPQDAALQHANALLQSILDGGLAASERRARLGEVSHIIQGELLKD